MIESTEICTSKLPIFKKPFKKCSKCLIPLDSLVTTIITVGNKLFCEDCYIVEHYPHKSS